MFGIFWLIQVAIILRGIEGIRFLESYAAPLLLGSSVALLIWGFNAGGGIGNVFSASSNADQRRPELLVAVRPGLAANVGYWITLSMNIPDFTRYAKDQRSQIVGQSIAMPLTMTGFSFIGIAVTAATIIVYGEPIWDPVTLVARLLADLPVLLVARDGDRRDRADLDEHGGQRRLAVERLLQPLAAPDLVPDGRHDHRGDRDHLVPVEAL